MSAPWFYQPNPSSAGSTVKLDRAEAKHAAGVKRLRDGDAIVLFDGAGTVAHGAVASTAGRELAVEIARTETVNPFRPAITVASAVPKGDRMAALLSQIAQLGASAFVPLECERSVAGAQKWLAGRGERIIIEACKQSHNPYLPELREPCTPMELAQRHANVWLAEPAGRPVREAVQAAEHCDQRTIAIGPEGGFTERERTALIEAGAIGVALGPTTLRIETAAVAMLSFLRLIASA